MPWDPGRRWKHSKKADTPKRSRQVAHVANSALERGASEESAIRQANAVVRRSKIRAARSRRT